MRRSFVSRSLLTSMLCSLAFALACGAGTKNMQTASNANTQAENANAGDANVASNVVPVSPTCALLSKADVEAIQGEAFADAQGSEHLGDGLMRSQCFYRLPTFDKSFNLEVVRADAKTGAKDALKEFWKEKFAREAIEEREREREEKERSERERERQLEQERERGQLREGGHEGEEEGEEEDETERPRRIASLGDEAFWTVGERGGSLYVLTKEAVLHLSLGGDANEATRARAVALARKILTHF